MADLIVETKNLSFSFSNSSPVIKNLNLNIEKGSVYGFLGRNGAGKTTTFKLLLGLLPVPKEKVFIFGEDITSSSINIFDNLGALIETPCLYEHLSGNDNLEIIRRTRKCAQPDIDKALSLVNLSHAKHITVKKYSLGMKQRLGLALALISNPKLLILDEPVNGLDPDGILEIRELFLTLAYEYSTTILISSHLLAELEKVITHAGIINNGELVFQGSYNELKNLQKGNFIVHFDTDNNKKALSLVSKRHPVSFTHSGSLEIKLQNREQVADICHQLMSENIKIYLAQSRELDLEEIFFQITRNKNYNDELSQLTLC